MHAYTALVFKENFCNYLQNKILSRVQQHAALTGGIMLPGVQNTNSGTQIWYICYESSMAMATRQLPSTCTLSSVLAQSV